MELHISGYALDSEVPHTNTHRQANDQIEMEFKRITYKEKPRSNFKFLRNTILYIL